MLGRLCLAAVASLALLTGCSGGGSADPAPSASASPPPTSAAPSPSESATRVASREDADVLLQPGGDQDLLAAKLPESLDHLRGVHVEITVNLAGSRRRLSLDWDAAGRCSGEIFDGRRTVALVTTNDGRTLVGRRGTTAGPWFVVDDLPVGDQCRRRVFGLVFAGEQRHDRQWQLVDARRIGSGVVNGRRAVRFRRTVGSVTADTWLAAEGRVLRLLRYDVRDVDADFVSTVVLSEHDSADPVLDEPSEDQIVERGAAQA